MIQGTKKALSLWEKIPSSIQIKLLNNAWCARCHTVCGIADAYLELLQGNLIIKGNCVACGADVVRCLDN